MKTQKFNHIVLIIMMLIVLSGGLLSATSPAKAAVVADVIVVPRNYLYDWGTSGESIRPDNPVYCSTNPDFTRIVEWRTNDGNSNAGVTDWNPNVPLAGNYDIYVYIASYGTTLTTVTTQAKYYLDGSLLATVDQTQNKCSWVWIGRRALSAGTGQTFSMPARTADSSYKLIAADGLKLVYVNTPPVAYNQSPVTAEDTAVGVTLGAYDADGDGISYAIGAGPAHGTLNGSVPYLTYTPALNYSGADSFTFYVGDGSVLSNTATVFITVNAVDDTPAANAQSISTAEDTPKAMTLSGSDIENSPLTYSIVSAPTHGGLSGTLPNPTYTPAANYNGPDSFTFKAYDGGLYSAPATVTITVTAVVDEPTAAGQTLITNEDTPLGITLVGLDGDNDPLIYSIVDAPAHGALSGTIPNLTYTPASHYFGPDSFTFRVYDGSAYSNTAVVYLTVNSTNDVPLADDQSLTTPNSTELGIDLSGSDADGDELTYRIIDGPAHGTLSGDAPTLTYTPNALYHGSDSFTFVTNDGTVDSAVATVSITVGLADLQMTVSPPNQQVIIGNTFVVSVQVMAGGQTVDHVQASLKFDPAMLRVKQINGNTGLLPTVIQHQYNNTDGTVDYEASTLSDLPTGSFTLLEIQFEALTITPITEITFLNSAPHSTDVTSGGESLLTGTVDGTVIITDRLKMFLPVLFGMQND